ncbi:MAG: hypothetical protein IJV64_07345 [Oscillospiraceae bacterium]|nr:hypothetical protein [Oscillospiraceae bacterium]
MINLKYLLLSQYPAMFLLALMSLFGFLRRRKKSATAATLYVLLFGITTACGTVFAYLGHQAGFWTLSTLLPLSGLSWAGIVLLAAFALVRLVHIAERRHGKRMLERERQTAERAKEDAVAAVRNEYEALSESAASTTEM